jgi:putative Holliday junction resolvase
LSALPPGSALAIDPGSKHTGFAISDPLRLIIQPLETWHGPGESEALLRAIDALAVDRQLGVILIGLPLNADGSDSARSVLIRAFAPKLQAHFKDLKVIMRNEHLSTKEAEVRLHDAGYRGAEIRERSDSWAAMVILEEWVLLGEPVTLEPEARD